MILSVDPGIRHCGVSLFRANELHAATTVKNPAKKGSSILEAIWMADVVAKWAADRAAGIEGISSVVVERMKIYPDGRTLGDPNVSLLPLVGVAYAVAALFPRAQHFEYLPRDWKGSTDGIACTLAIRERLSSTEFGRIDLPHSACEACRTHFARYCLKGERGCGADHVYDAVGIGLKHLGRFERRRIYPR